MPRVLLAVPCGRQAPFSPFFDAFYQVDLPAGSIRQRAVSGHLSRNIQLIFKKALDAEMDYVCVVDDDTVFPPDMVTRLLAHGKDRVAPLVCHRVPPFHPFIMDGLGPGQQIEYKPLTECERVPDSPLLKVPGVAGCVGLIATSILRQLPHPKFPENTPQPDGTILQGDMLFTQQLYRMGVETYVDTSVSMPHAGSFLVDWKFTEERGWYVNLNMMVSLPPGRALDMCEHPEPNGSEHGDA